MNTACLGRFTCALLFAVCAFLLAGCKPQPPEHGITFVVTLDLTSVPASEHAAVLERAERALTRRVDRIGVPAFPQARGTNSVVLNVPRGSTNIMQEVRSAVSRTFHVEFRLVHASSDEHVAVGVTPPGYEVKTQQAMGKSMPLIVSKRSIASPTGRNIASAHMMKGSIGEPQVAIQFDEAGQRAFADVTRTNVARQLAILIDGQVYSAPMIREPIPGGSATISGGTLSAQEALLIAHILSNPLPVPILSTEEKIF